MYFGNMISITQSPIAKLFRRTRYINIRKKTEDFLKANMYFN